MLGEGQLVGASEERQRRENGREEHEHAWDNVAKLRLSTAVDETLFVPGQAIDDCLVSHQGIKQTSRGNRKVNWGSPFLRCTIAAMKKGAAPKSRRRSRQTLDKKILVYFTQAERELVDKAADLERRSISSFVANAAIVAAERIVTKRNK